MSQSMVKFPFKWNNLKKYLSKYYGKLRKYFKVICGYFQKNWVVFVFVNKKVPFFEVLVSEIQQFFWIWVENIVLQFLTFLTEETLLFQILQTTIRYRTFHFCSMEVQNSRRYSHYLKLKVVFFSLKNFKAVFLETLFFKSSTSKCYISESFALWKLGEVSIDPNFYLILGSSHNSIPQKWDLLRFTYTFVDESL